MTAWMVREGLPERIFAPLEAGLDALWFGESIQEKGQQPNSRTDFPSNCSRGQNQGQRCEQRQEIG